MIIIVLVFVFTSALATVHAGQTNGDQTNRIPFQLPNSAVTGPRSNIVVFFQSPETHSAIFPANKPIHFGFASTTEAYYQLFMLQPKYGYRIALASKDGKPMKLTSIGAKYGEEFNKIKAFNKAALDMSYIPGLYNPDTPYWAYAASRGSIGVSRQLPAPDKLFKIDQPGKYTMSLTLKCFFRPGPAPASNYYSTNIYLVTFPEAKIKIIKSDTKVK